MGNSFVQFRNQGYWARDPDIELWLYLAAQEIESIASPPAWLLELAAEWRIQATAGFNGCVSSCLDDYLVTEERVLQLSSLCTDLLWEVERATTDVQPEVLTAWGIGGENVLHFGPSPRHDVVAFGVVFLHLLRGERIVNQFPLAREVGP